MLDTLKQQVLALCVSDQHDINFFSELFDHRLHPVEGGVLLSPLPLVSVVLDRLIRFRGKALFIALW